MNRPAEDTHCQYGSLPNTIRKYFITSIQIIAGKLYKILFPKLMFTYTRYLPLERCTSHMPLEPLSLPMFCSYKSPSLGKEVILESKQ